MPKPFRLQALLEHKRLLEDQQMLALAACEAEWRRACEVLDMLIAAEAEQMAHLDRMARATRIDAAEQRDAVAHLGRIEASIAQQRETVVTAEAGVQQSRDALVEILKEKRSLERLREQHVVESEREEARREADAADEITSARYTRITQGRG